MVPTDIFENSNPEKLSNKFEYLHPDWDNETINETAISYCKIPDGDGDNITNGKEIKGYWVKIITGWYYNGTPISERSHVWPDEVDPLMPYSYNLSSGFQWMDTDIEDNIPVAADLLGLMAITGGTLSLIISIIGAAKKWVSGLGTTIALILGVVSGAIAIWTGTQSLSFL